MRAAKAPEGLIAKYQAMVDLPPDYFEVWNKSAGELELFKHMDTQWRWASAGSIAANMGSAVGQIEGHRVGFDYSALEVVARVLAIELTPERFQWLRLMELAALDELTKIARERMTRQ